MIKYILTFLSSLLLIFLDHLFFTSLGVYISPILILVIFDIMPFDLFFVFILLLSLGLDVTFHYSLGLWLLISVISLLLFRLFNLLVHTDNLLVKLAPVILSTVSLYILLRIVPFLPHFSLIFDAIKGSFFDSLIKAIISTLLYAGLYTIALYFRSDKSSRVKFK